MTVTDLGHEEPTILLTNNHRIGCPALVTRYAQRMLIENGISAAVQFFHLDALSSMVTLDKRAHNPFLLQARLGDEPTPMPWFGDKPLRIAFS